MTTYDLPTYPNRPLELKLNDQFVFHNKNGEIYYIQFRGLFIQDNNSHFLHLNQSIGKRIFFKKSSLLEIPISERIFKVGDSFFNILDYSAERLYIQKKF